MSLYLGLDTSAYTTSLALVGHDGGLAADLRRVLEVPHGARGLRQSQALFQHVRNLPLLVAELDHGWGRAVAGVAGAVRPRPLEGSYMPVFSVGESQGRAVSGALGVPFWPTTHQEGHLAAALGVAGLAAAGRLLAVHLSGGTSEILVVEHPEPGCLRVRVVGGSQDLHAGQFIDRLGVALGLPFPAGPALEQLARGADERGQPKGLPLKTAVRGGFFSLSGPETQARRLMQEGAEAALLARGVEHCLAVSLAQALAAVIEETGLRQVLLAGGVCANLYLRRCLEERLPGIGLDFAPPGLSGDNAVGVALLARERFGGGEPVFET